MSQEDNKGCTPVFYAGNNKQPDGAAKAKTLLVATELELVPQSTVGKF